MRDASAEIQRGVYLSLQSALSDFKPQIFDHTPMGDIDIKRPVIVIGGSSSSSTNSKGGIEQRHVIDIIVVLSAKGRQRIKTICAKIIGALHKSDLNPSPIAIDFFNIMGPLFDSRDAVELDPSDQPVFSETLRFVVYSEQK
jgi:hypothetical protein